MPKAKKRNSQLQDARDRRQSNTKILDASDSSGDEYRMDIDDKELNFGEKLLLTDIGDLAKMFHDESTFRSGEVSPKRWFFQENTPFFSKGRGRSHMVSDFLVQHPSGPFFELSENEWQQSVRKYQSLSVAGDVNYLDRTATASINIGTDAYFDNDTILGQFETLFQMLEFKQEYKDHQIEIIVDNARTHTAKSYSLQDFGKNVGTRCPVEEIEYVDENGATKVVDCYFKGGENKDKSKGLIELCIDLGAQLPDKIELDEIREILSHIELFE
ncbi:unnamed protein product, partial [Rotaria sp. Silwood2]